ncbi:tellurium resistance protein (plasmid) [Burkholderia sp. SFA1]|nr:tellurium resistance protein [Burkholderia sp. SFA1]
MKPLFDDEKQSAPQMPVVQPVPSTAGLGLVAARAGSVGVPRKLMSDDEIDAIGTEHGAAAASMSRTYLSTVRAADGGAFGEKLNELIAIAKGLDPKAMHKGSLLGRVGNLLKSTKERLLAQYDDVNQRIDTLVAQLEVTAKKQKDGISTLEQMYTFNYTTHQGLEEGKRQCENALADYRAALGAEEAAKDAFAAQRLMDMQRRIDALTVKVDDLNRAMLLTKQLAPQIRTEQDRKRTLGSKFATVKTILIPAWTNAFSLYLEQLDTKVATDLVNATYDATDAALRAQADLGRQNAQEVARLSQRPVVATETFEYAQQQLFGALDDINQIVEEGERQREQDASRLRQLEQDLVSRFSPKNR